LIKPSGLVLLIAAVALAPLGCDRADVPDLGQVTGIVTLDKNPLAQAWVRFVPQGEGLISNAITDQTGRYELEYGHGEAMGAALGTHTVEITMPPNDPDALIEFVYIPPRYNDQSTLTATVKEGENTFNFDLLSK